MASLRESIKYFGLLKGECISLQEFQGRGVKEAVNTLFKDGEIVGQGTLFDKDIVLAKRGVEITLPK